MPRSQAAQSTVVTYDARANRFQAAASSTSTSQSRRNDNAAAIRRMNNDILVKQMLLRLDESKSHPASASPNRRAAKSKPAAKRSAAPLVLDIGDFEPYLLGGEETDVYSNQLLSPSSALPFEPSERLPPRCPTGSAVRQALNPIEARNRCLLSPPKCSAPVDDSVDDEFDLMLQNAALGVSSSSMQSSSPSRHQPTGESLCYDLDGAERSGMQRVAQVQNGFWSENRVETPKEPLSRLLRSAGLPLARPLSGCRKNVRNIEFTSPGPGDYNPRPASRSNISATR